MAREPGRARPVDTLLAARAVAARLRLVLGIDFHILHTLLLRGWSIVAGGVMVLFVPHWFGAVEQGYYYTLLSLIAIQIFFELGMNQIIVQFVSHEAAVLRDGEAGALVGERSAVTRIASLERLIARWYRAAAILFFLIGSTAGTVFFHDRGGGVREAIIWVALVLFTSINLFLSPSLAILEGFGRVGDVARVRLTQSILGYLTMWAALSLGAGLFATPMLAAVGALYTGYWLSRHDRRLRWLRSVVVAPEDETLSWRRHVLPLQWRIALSWVSGYLTLQLLVPMIFAHRGAVEAGRLGLTLTIFNSLLSIGLSWVNARLPGMAAHFARGERGAARNLFWAVTIRSTIITGLGSLAVGAMVALLPEAWRMRFADYPTIACLSVATVVNCVIYAMATFVRAHKEEPLLIQSVASALLMVPAVYFGSYQGTAAMMTLYVLIVVLLALPWVAVIFHRYYRREA